MAKPDIDGMAIEIAKSKGKMPMGDGPEVDPVTPEQLDDAHEMLQAMKMGDAQGFATSLCNFMDKYNDSSSSDEPADAPPAPPEE